MGQAATIDTADIASLTGWWRLAGVDTAIGEEPRRWLGEPAAETKPTVAAPVEAPAPLPVTLEVFADWLMSAEIPDAGPPRRRVRPSGDPAAGLMILTDLPELADIDAGLLIAGELGAMFERMLARLDRSRDTVYLASLSPGRPPSGRIAAAALDRLGEIARHHVGLAAPRQLWLMGDAASRAILGTDQFAAAGKLHTVNLDGVMIDAIATAHPRRLEKPEDRKRAWADMQRLIAGTGA
ncbi:MAG: uracil-DNA glycosylase [Sphingomonadaceae bacterium]|nr:uracil-DNA glycosylase [Sphingomonadaceae bacterium]